MKQSAFYQSEVLRELERQAVRKGFFDLTPEEKVKLAAQAVQGQHSLEPTGDLLRDLTILAQGLRQKGYDKQADDLERKLLLFKSAEATLYHAIDETGEDLLDFAHPEGEFSVGESELGRVETTMSAAKKILDVVKKQPQAKQAMVEFIEGAQKQGLASKIIREAQEEEVFNPVVQARRKVVDAFRRVKFAQATFKLPTNHITLGLDDLKRGTEKLKLYLKYIGTGATEQDFVDVRVVMSGFGATPHMGGEDRFREWIKRGRAAEPQLRQWAKALDVDANTYLYGYSRLAPASAVGEAAGLTYTKNPKSIYMYRPLGLSPLVANEPNVNEFANKLFTAYKALFDKVFGENWSRIDKMAERLRAIVEAYTAGVQGVEVGPPNLNLKDLKGIPQEWVGEGVVNYQKVAAVLAEAQSKFQDIYRSRETKEVEHILNVFAGSKKGHLSGEALTLRWNKLLGPKGAFAQAYQIIGGKGSFGEPIRIEEGIIAALTATQKMWVAVYREAEREGDEANAKKYSRYASIDALLIQFLKPGEPFMSMVARAQQAGKSEPYATLAKMRNNDQLNAYLRAAVNFKPAGAAAATDGDGKLVKEGKTYKTTTTPPPGFGPGPTPTGFPKVRRPGKARRAPEPEPTKSAVMQLQALLMDFGKEIGKNPKPLMGLLGVTDPEKVESEKNRFSQAMINVGGKKSPPDGKWGELTQGALKLVNEIAAKLPGEVKKVHTEVDGKIYPDYEAKEAEKLAEENVIALAKIMMESGYSAALPSTYRMRFESFDNIHPVLHSRTITLKPSTYDPKRGGRGGVEILPVALSNLYEFYNLVEGLQVGMRRGAEDDASNKLLKVAHKIAQMPRRHPGRGGPPGEEPDKGSPVERFPGTFIGGVGAVTVGKMDRALAWFWRRAYVLLDDARRSKDEEAMKRMRMYRDMIRDLGSQWSIAKNYFTNPNTNPLFNKEKKPEEQLVDAEILRRGGRGFAKYRYPSEWGYYGLPGYGRPGVSPGYPGYSIGPGVEATGRLKNPLGPTINIREVTEQWDKVAKVNLEPAFWRAAIRGGDISRSTLEGNYETVYRFLVGARPTQEQLETIWREDPEGRKYDPLEILAGKIVELVHKLAAVWD
jgi:hypothetical protein